MSLIVVLVAVLLLLSIGGGTYHTWGATYPAWGGTILWVLAIVVLIVILAKLSGGPRF